jgi:4-hydroxybenzoate polyprenyltransferase
MTWSFYAYLRLIRMDRALSAAFGVLFTGVFVGDLTGYQSEYVVAFFVVLFSAFANFGFNDYFDLDVDRLNHRMDRPLVEGALMKRTALVITGISSFIAIALTMFLNPLARILILVGLPLTLLYHLGVKRVFFLKNAFIGFTNIGIIMLGSLVSDAFLEPMAFFLVSVGFFVGLSYEIMLDIADVEGDRVHGIDTIPARFGIRTAVLVSVLLGVGAVFVDPLPFFIMIDPRLYRDSVFLLLMITIVASRLFISLSLYRDHSRENVLRLKKRAFRNIQLGCVCFLVGILL